MGLSADEEQVYEAHVAAPGSTVVALADHLVIPADGLADVLTALSAKQLVSRSGDPCRYVAAPPDIAINQLVQLREWELSAARAKVYSLSEIHPGANRTSSDLVIEQLTDREAIAAAVAHMESEARVQVRVFVTPPRSPLFTALEALFEGEWAQANPLDATAMTPSATTGVADPDKKTAPCWR